MKLQNTKQIFKNALKGNYAVGAFNFVNMESLQGILSGAKEEKSPVIVQCSTGAIKYAGGKTLCAMVKSFDCDIPVVLNLDHGKTFEDCKLAIDCGFTNVMIDGSHLPFQENVLLTKKVVDYAHAKNVTVEGELGVLAGVEEDVKAKDNVYTIPEQAKEFVDKTGVDSLAIAIGTSHGTHKFKGEGKLRFDILAQIQTLLPNFPFVLHGASSIPKDMLTIAQTYGANLKDANGVPEHLLKDACHNYNICKVNVDSDLRIAFTAGVRETLALCPENVDMRNYCGKGKEYIKNTVMYKIKNIFGSSFKA